MPVQVETSECVSVLSNLIKNAQEATDDGGVIEVRLVRHDDYALVSVEDNGSGMSEDFVRKRLFRPFDSTKGSQGMGIGVYHAREYMRRLGGDLNVDTSPGDGTTMTLRMPIASEAP